MAVNRELLLCGGAINSVQTLHEFEKRDIPVKRRLDDVGHHLRDHFCCSGILCKAKPNFTLDYLTSV